MKRARPLKRALLIMTPFTVIAFTLASCLETPEETTAPAGAEQPSVTTMGTSGGMPATTGTQGGDGSALALQSLASGDMSEKPLEGELGCAFALTAGGEPLLVAMGDVADRQGRAQFVAKWGGVVSRGIASEAGGFDAMLDGARFAAKGMTLEVALTSGEPAGSGESPPVPAALTAMRADGAERVYEGFWTCGP